MSVVRRSLVPIAVGLTFSACVKVQSTTAYKQTLISTRTSVKTLDDSLRYTVDTRVDEQALVLSVSQAETCRTKKVPIYRKEAHITNEAAPDARGRALGPGTTGIAGALLLGSGVYGYANADTLGVTNAVEGESTPDDYRSGGIVLSIAGGVFLGIALIDAIRLADDHEVVGNVEGEPEVTDDECHEKATAGAEIVAAVPKMKWRVEGKTDSEGKARIDLHDLPEDAFASPELRIRLAINGMPDIAIISEKRTRRLMDALAADATSRLSLDRAERARAGCAEQVAAASAVAIDADTSAPMIARIESAWSNARTKCGENWEPGHEQALQAFRTQLAATAAERAVNQCAAALESAAELISRRSDPSEVLDLDELREAVVARCLTASNKDSVLAAFDAKEKAARKERARAEKIDKLVGSLAARLDANDAVGFRAIVSKDSDAAGLLRTNSEVAKLLVQLAEHWIRKAERGDTNTPQLCAARSLILSFVGQSAWANLRTSVAKRNDVAKGARIATEMDGGKCK